MSGLVIFDLICYLVAVIMFLLGGINVVVTRDPRPAFGPINFIAFGLLAWVLVPLVNLIATQ